MEMSLVRNIGVAVLCTVLVAAGAAAQDARGIQVASRTEGGGVSGRIGGHTIDLGTYHALLIGINDYQDEQFAKPLKTARADVETVRDLLIRDYGFDAANVKVLVDSAASRAGIYDALQAYRDRPLGPKDNLLVYYAGHGWQHTSTEDGFWIPADGTSAESSWVSVTDIRRIFRAIGAKHVLLVSDSCFAGTLGDRTIATVPTDDRYLAEVAAKESYQVITSGGLEPVADGGRGTLSLFAYFFTTYLRNQQSGYVTASRLLADIAPLVANASGSRQTPEINKIPEAYDRNGEFIFARVDSAARLAPSAARSADAPPVSFGGISFRAPPGWNVTIDDTDQFLSYSEPQTSVGLMVMSSRDEPETAQVLASNDRPRTVRYLCEDFARYSEDRSSFRTTVIAANYRRLGDLIAYTCEMSTTGRANTYMRMDNVIDPRDGTMYGFTILGPLDAREVGARAVEGVLSSVRRRTQ